MVGTQYVNTQAHEPFNLTLSSGEITVQNVGTFQVTAKVGVEVVLLEEKAVGTIRITKPLIRNTPLVKKRHNKPGCNNTVNVRVNVDQYPWVGVFLQTGKNLIRILLTKHHITNLENQFTKQNQLIQ